MREREAPHVTDHEVVGEGEGGEERGEDEDVDDVALLRGSRAGHQPGGGHREHTEREPGKREMGAPGRSSILRHAF